MGGFASGMLLAAIGDGLRRLVDYCRVEIRKADLDLRVGGVTNPDPDPGANPNPNPGAPCIIGAQVTPSAPKLSHDERSEGAALLLSASKSSQDERPSSEA
jgi:hypothetical protein